MKSPLHARSQVREAFHKHIKNTPGLGIGSDPGSTERDERDGSLHRAVPHGGNSHFVVTLETDCTT